VHCFGSGGCAGAALGLHYSLGAVVVVLPVVGAALGLRYSLVVVVEVVVSEVGAAQEQHC
jgi:hypothetical protein